MGDYSCVIVDDEPPARLKLRTFLEQHPRIDVAEEATDGLTAVEVIDRVRPNLVLLDIQMPEVDGFGVLEALELDPLPYVIFVTAYDQYAVRAFEVGALDYLLKPVDPGRFSVALERALGRLDSGESTDVERRIRRALADMPASGPHLERFLVRRRGRAVLVPVGDVEWIAASGNYLKLGTRSDTYLFRGKMKEVCERLDPARFARIHRSAIVNLDEVSYLEPWSHGDQLVVMRSGVRLVMSRRFRDRLGRVLRG